MGPGIGSTHSCSILCPSATSDKPSIGVGIELIIEFKYFGFIVEVFPLRVPAARVFENEFCWNRMTDCYRRQRNDGVVLDIYEAKLNAVLRKSYLVPFHEP